MEAVLAAIADPQRRTILEVLEHGPATVAEVAEALPIARAGVSRHLRILREAGLVEVRPDAQRRIYELKADGLIELDEWLAPYRRIWMQRMDALHTEVARGTKERTRG